MPKNVNNNPMEEALKVMFTQMRATVGFKLFGEKAIAAMIKELKQSEEGPMPGKKVIKAIDPDTLSDEDKKHALNAINLIKLKKRWDHKRMNMR